MNFQRYGLALATLFLILITNLYAFRTDVEDAIRSVFIDSLIHVESRGRDNAVSRDGSAGPLQIKSVLVKDVNRILARRGDTLRFNMKDRFDREKAIQMFWIYQSFYGKETDTYETMARRWNGGPNGHKMRATAKYWKKVNSQFTTRIKNNPELLGEI
jgi:soluble lytic murein transglycosylase-like protein